MATSVPPPPDKLKRGVPPLTPAPPGTKRKQGKVGLKMKSPGKKRKSNTQGPAYSHLTEFAPCLPHIVDHLVASNPSEDVLRAPKVGGAAPPFLGSRVSFGGFCEQGGMAGQVRPGGIRGGPQPLHQQHPPFPPNPMGLVFNMNNPHPQHTALQGPGCPRGNMSFPSQTFLASGSKLQPPGGQMMPGLGGQPMSSPTIGQPLRGELGIPSLPQHFVQPGAAFGPSLQRPCQGFPSLPSNTSPFPGPNPGFPGLGDGGKALNPPAPSAFSQEPYSGSLAAAVNDQPSLSPPALRSRTANSSGRGGGTLETNSLAPRKASGDSGPQPLPPGVVYTCGTCCKEVSNDRAVLCEANTSTRMKSTYGLLTTEASASWACDLCLKTKEIQSYIHDGVGQRVAANDG
ncbi:LOW QUALITY PROTEIN: pygopus homolog 2 [Lycaon pictus]